MDTYWYTAWLKANHVTGEAALRRTLGRSGSLESFINSAPPPQVWQREKSSTLTELTAGKGIDLTGALGCHHIGCLTQELHGLFRHAWHYFDRIILPDQALFSVVGFERHGNVERLIEELVPFTLLLRLIDKDRANELVRFETRMPACREHFKAHAREAGIDQAFTNLALLVKEISNSAEISWSQKKIDDHVHLDFRLDHPAFEHSEWGSVCSIERSLPKGDAAIRKAIATEVLRKYLSELSADALAARHNQTALGSTIPFYKQLLAADPTPQVEDIAFELALPIASDISVESLIKLRTNETECFERFQAALRMAIGERLKTVSSPNADALAREIKQDVIEPELRRIRDRLAASRTLALRGAAGGLTLGAVAATVGLLTPLKTNAVGAGLTVGGALTMGAASLKKALDDHLTVRRDVALSDMYFLWKAHRH